MAAVDGKSWGEGCAGGGGAEVRLGVGKSAALVGAEGVDGLAGEVVVLQEGEHCHGHGAAEIGVAQVDFIVAVQIFRQIHQGGPGVRLTVLHGLGDTLPVVFGIGLLLLDFQQTSAGEGGQLPGTPGGVAGFDFPVGAAEIILSRPGVVCNQNCHGATSYSFSNSLATSSSS